MPLSPLHHLRANHQGTLIADGSASTIRIVLDHDRIVFPATSATIGAEDLTLFLPCEDPPDDDELQLMLGASPLDPDHSVTDRWAAYHGRSPLTHWAACSIEGARFQGGVVDHDVFQGLNPLDLANGRLCKLLNADRPRLAALCLRMIGMAPAEPVAVGVDDLGIDVRAALGIVRLPFAEPITNPDAAAAHIASILGTS